MEAILNFLSKIPHFLLGYGIDRKRDRYHLSFYFYSASKIHRKRFIRFYTNYHNQKFKKVIFATRNNIRTYSTPIF